MHWTRAPPSWAWTPGDATHPEGAGPGGSSARSAEDPTPGPRDEGPSPAPWPCLGLVTDPEPLGRHSADPHALSPERSRHSFEVLQGCPGVVLGWSPGRWVRVQQTVREASK